MESILRLNGMFTFEMSEGEYAEMSEEYAGLCTSCGAEVYGVEPDARNYKCSECGEDKVYGLEELLVMGLISFEEE